MEQIHEKEMATHEDQGKLLKWIGGNKKPEPTFSQIKIHKGDQFLLCSDGLWEHVNVEQMEKVLNKTKDPKKAVNAFVDMAKRSGGNKGDNISVALLSINKDENKKIMTGLLLIYAVLLLIIAFLSGYLIFSPKENPENSQNKIENKQDIHVKDSISTEITNEKTNQGK